MKKDILRHELIGSHARVIDAKNKVLIGIDGKIVDETRNMISIENNGITKRLIKNQVMIELKRNGFLYHINGSYLVNRPEDRIKKTRTVVK